MINTDEMEKTGWKQFPWISVLRKKKKNKPKTKTKNKAKIKPNTKKLWHCKAIHAESHSRHLKQ